MLKLIQRVASLAAVLGMTATVASGQLSNTREIDLPMAGLNQTLFFGSGFIFGAQEFAGGEVIAARVQVEITVEPLPDGDPRNNGAEFFVADMVLPIDTDPATPGVQAFTSVISGASEGWSGTGTFSLVRDIPEVIGGTFAVPLFFTAQTFGGDDNQNIVNLAEPINAGIDEPPFEVEDGWFFTVRRPAAPCNAADVAPEFGVLNANDIIDFVNGFNNGTEVADVSPPGGDGLFDANDVIDFVTAFNAGCP